MRAIVIFMILILPTCIYGQQAKSELELKPSAQEKRDNIIEKLRIRLSKSNCKKIDCKALEYHIHFIQNALDAEPQGDGIRYTWMEKMQQYGVKQASFAVHFNWKNRQKDTFEFNINGMAYYQEYYDSASIVKEEKLLRRIRKEGLEKELKSHIIEMCKKICDGTTKNSSGCLLNLNLLDDETLPPFHSIL